MRGDGDAYSLLVEVEGMGHQAAHVGTRDQDVGQRLGQMRGFVRLKAGVGVGLTIVGACYDIEAGEGLHAIHDVHRPPCLRQGIGEGRQVDWLFHWEGDFGLLGKEGKMDANV